MSVHNHGYVGAGRSIASGLAKAVGIGFFGAGLFWYLLHVVYRTVPTNWALLLTFLAWGIASALLYNAMVKNTGNVRPGYLGVHTVLGEMTGTIFSAAEHPLLPGIEDVIEVDARNRQVDPPVFEELAKDKVPVYIDGYALVRVVDPILYLTAIAEEDAIEVLKKLFDAEIRLFVAQWKRAVDLIAQRELLTRFLKLSGPDDPDHARLEHALMDLTMGDNPPLDPPSVRNIMEDSGKFCASAGSWGFTVVEIHMERVDLPDRLKTAAANAAAAVDDMKPLYVKKAAIAEMVQELTVSFPSIPERDLLIFVQQLAGVPVNRSINEIEIRGLNIPPDLSRSVVQTAQAIAERLNRRSA